MLSEPSSAAPVNLPLCVLIPAGPGPAELARVTDLAAACAAYTDRPLAFVIINDSNDAFALEQAGRATGFATTVRPNARAGEGDWATGGLSMAMLDTLQWIARHVPCCGVLRLDSDALVINPYAGEIAGIFARDASVGLLGNFDSASGRPVPPGHIMTTRLYWRSKRISHDREQKRFTFSFWGWRRRTRHLIKRAQSHGYILGDWCQGGAYALSPEFLRRLAADPAFARPRDFLHTDFGEDVLMALITYALALRIEYTVGPARLFASKWKGLYDAPAALAAAGHGIIHSLKNHAGRSEADTRAFFVARRPRGSEIFPGTAPTAASTHENSPVLANDDPDQHAGGILAAPPMAGRYDRQDYAAGESTALIGGFIPAGARVLDIGCGTGSVSRLLREHRHATVVGIEPNAERAALCRTRGIEVHTGFLTAELLATLGQFDAVVFADVLEHLADPSAMLRLVRPALKPGGVVVASMPNIAHWTVRARLLLGRFNYSPSGIMDATHLRWFTFQTARELFERSGFVVNAMGGSAGAWMTEYARTPVRVRRRLLPLLARVWPTLFACQVIVRAPLAPGAERSA